MERNETAKLLSFLPRRSPSRVSPPRLSPSNHCPTRPSRSETRLFPLQFVPMLVWFLQVRRSANSGCSRSRSADGAERKTLKLQLSMNISSMSVKQQNRNGKSAEAAGVRKQQKKRRAKATRKTSSSKGEQPTLAPNEAHEQKQLIRTVKAAVSR